MLISSFVNAKSISSLATFTTDGAKVPRTSNVMHLNMIPKIGLMNRSKITVSTLPLSCVFVSAHFVIYRLCVSMILNKYSKTV